MKLYNSGENGGKGTESGEIKEQKQKLAERDGERRDVKNGF